MTCTSLVSLMQRSQSIKRVSHYCCYSSKLMLGVSRDRQRQYQHGTRKVLGFIFILLQLWSSPILSEYYHTVDFTVCRLVVGMLYMLWRNYCIVTRIFTNEESVLLLFICHIQSFWIWVTYKDKPVFIIAAIKQDRLSTYTAWVTAALTLKLIFILYSTPSFRTKHCFLKASRSPVRNQEGNMQSHQYLQWCCYL